MCAQGRTDKNMSQSSTTGLTGSACQVRKQEGRTKKFSGQSILRPLTSTPID